MKIGIRDLVRNSNILDGYDYVEVEDKKTHEYKVFLYLQNMPMNLKLF